MLLAYLSFLLLVVGFALWRGGAPERLCALVFVLMAVLQYPSQLLFGKVFSTVDVVSLGVDVVAFAAFTLVAMVANRSWPLCIAAMQLLSCASHFGREASDKVEPLVYAVLKAGPTAAAVLILFIGTLAHQYRRAVGRQIQPWVADFRPPFWLPKFLML